MNAPDLASGAPTAALARFAHAADFTQLDPDARRATRRHFLDSLGACVGGLDQSLVREATRLSDSLSGGGSIPVTGTARRTDLLGAIYQMAVSCHAIELDDGNREGSIHPGTVVVPAVLGLGYRLDASGADALAAVVAGYEAMIALAEVLHPHASQRGFQTTGVVGPIGAAAAAARLLRLDVTRVEKAIGIAASSGAGLFAYLTGGGNVKKLHQAHAAREGVFAALLAERDVVDGPLGVAETKAGVFQAFAGIVPGAPARPARTRTALAIQRSYLKPYPCCRHIHPAIDGLLALRTEHRLAPDDVASIDVGTYPAAMPHATLGWESLTIAQLSFPYVMAVALRTGKVDLESFSDASRADPRILADTAKVKVAPDDECTRNYPKEGPARVTLGLRDGRTITTYVADPRGCPEVPMSDEDLFAKFRLSVAGRLAPAAADRLIERLWSDAPPSVREIVDVFTMSRLQGVTA